MILIAGQRIDTETALDWGLFDRITPEGESALGTARALAADALAADPAHVAGIKALCRP
jgi:enoyl-CoA hydratase/carnithine racemase